MRADLEVGACYLARQRLLHHFKQGRGANFLQRGVGHFCGSRGLRGIWEFKMFIYICLVVSMQCLRAQLSCDLTITDLPSLGIQSFMVLHYLHSKSWVGFLGLPMTPLASRDKSLFVCCQGDCLNLIFRFYW